MNEPTIADDILHCTLYILQGEDRSVVLTQLASYTHQLLPSHHIWHRDSFEFVLSTDHDQALECSMRVGDSVDDEWLVVFLLWQITKAFNVAIRSVTRHPRWPISDYILQCP